MPVNKADDELFVENPKLNRCPKCGEVYSFENDKRILYRNVLLFFCDQTTGKKKVKCRTCKTLIDC
jgi:hypothetical protein